LFKSKPAVRIIDGKKPPLAISYHGIILQPVISRRPSSMGPEIFEKCHINPAKRPETLSPEDYISIANYAGNSPFLC